MQNTYKQEYMCELSLLCIATYSTTYAYAYISVSNTRVINKNKQQ